MSFAPLICPSWGKDAHRWSHDVLLLLRRLADNLEGKSAFLKNGDQQLSKHLFPTVFLSWPMRFCSHFVFLRFSWLFKERLLFKDSWTDASLQKTFFSRQMYKTSRFCLNMPDAYFLSMLLCCMFPLGCLDAWIYCRSAKTNVLAAELMDRTELNLILWPWFQNYLRYLNNFFHSCHFNISTETEPLQKWVQNPLCFEEQRSMLTELKVLSHCIRTRADKSTKNNQIPLHHGFRWFWLGQFSLSATQRNAGVQGWFLKHITRNSFRYLNLLINTFIIMCIFKKLNAE